MNIGGSEILVILVVAFIVLGPDRVTKVGHDLGAWMRKLNKSEAFRDVVHTTEEIRNYPQKIMDEVMLDPNMNGAKQMHPDASPMHGDEPEASAPEKQDSEDLP
ncbi:MAG: twin-arginine translocase TatA/TatE family subunit [Anaerolineaceae bacterium]